MLAPFRHLIGSTRYSFQGMAVLLREMAARIEVGAFVIALIILVLIGAPLHHWIMLSVLFLIVMAAEALNTAIEVIVDRISPEHSDFARDAKDLGSAGVFCSVLAAGLFLCAACLSAAGLISF